MTPPPPPPPRKSLRRPKPTPKAEEAARQGLLRKGRKSLRGESEEGRNGKPTLSPASPEEEAIKCHSVNADSEVKEELEEDCCKEKKEKVEMSGKNAKEDDEEILRDGRDRFPGCQ